METAKELNQVFWIGTLIMFFLAFGILFLVFSYRNYFIKMKQQEAELLLKVALETEKKERERIAADLHDSVSSDLSAIRNYLVVLLRGEPNEERAALFQELREGVETAIENTRMVSYKLMPPLLDKFGLAIALEDYLKRLTKQTAIPFDIIQKEAPLVVNALVGYELFRIVQEFTTNMLKYGNISRCNITLYALKETVGIELIDDGVVFNFEKEQALSRGAGLKNITSRLRVIGATLDQKEVAQGNHFVISLPLSGPSKS